MKGLFIVCIVFMAFYAMTPSSVEAAQQCVTCTSSGCYASNPSTKSCQRNASRCSYVGKAETKNHSWLRAVLLIKCFRDAGVTTSVTTRRKSLEAQTTICASIAAQETTVTQTLQALRAFRWRVASSWRLRPLLWRWWNIFSSEWSKNQLKQPKRWLSCIVA